MAGIVLVHHGYIGLLSANLFEPVIRELIAAGAGMFLLAGFFTPVTGTLVAILEIWISLSRPHDPCTSFLLSALGAGLAMLGPGAWSIDAHLYGRKRIEIRAR